MECALWLNRHKIRDAAEIPQNLDIASLRGYFLAGSLVEWLEEHGGADYASALAEIPPDSPDLNARISEIFGGAPIEGKPLNGTSSVTLAPSGDWRGSSFGSYGEFGSIWKSVGSFGSFYLTSGGMYKWLLEFGAGSFGSFRFTSGGMYEWEWEWLFGFGGSFAAGSFGSYSAFGEWENLLAQWRSGSFGSFAFGSFPWNLAEALGSYQGFPIMDEYDLILLQTLLNCPLDRYGYGIHII